MTPDNATNTDKNNKFATMHQALSTTHNHTPTPRSSQVTETDLSFPEASPAAISRRCFPLHTFTGPACFYRFTPFHSNSRPLGQKKKNTQTFLNFERTLNSPFFTLFHSEDSIFSTADRQDTLRCVRVRNDNM